MGRNKLDSKLVKNKQVVIRVNSIEIEGMRKRRISPAKMFRKALATELNYTPEFKDLKEKFK